ncbi:MAG: fructose-bisphosphatase class II [Alphaproteobacteria bacterium]|nr:fructose-bisphosphatase class II [Alphaproteobacteria bacterium]
MAVTADISLDARPEDNVRAVAAALGRQPSEVTVRVLDRPRHAQIVQSVRAAGARVRLIGEGDVVGALLPSLSDSGVDLYLGTGQAPEGVFAAAALRGLGGRVLVRLAPRNDDERAQMNAVGISDFHRIYGTDDLATGHIIFAAAGLTPGPLLDGAHIGLTHAYTHSVVIRSRTGSVRWIKTHHRLDENGNLRLGN